MKFKTPFDSSDANSRLKPIAVYKLYLVMKNHFAGKYDAIKYKWEIKITEKAFEKRRDKYFSKVSRKVYIQRNISYTSLQHGS